MIADQVLRHSSHLVIQIYLHCVISEIKVIVKIHLIFCSLRKSNKTFHDASSTMHVTMNMEGCAFQIRFRDRRNRVIHNLIFGQQKCPVTRLMQPAL